MGKIIASTYEILREIGAGGGGTVYLAHHSRLDKLVVLKVDNRRHQVNLKSLRREVDALKNLSHSYIPQVYDFIEEDGVYYTVMDFIEGESLDKSLARGEIFTQPQILKWADQLLQALEYLHQQPPNGILHGDIKPANIMLTPKGDICLIDYNIALALGESGAVRVGFSSGYASPEHYGLDYRDLTRTQSTKESPETRYTVSRPETMITESNYSSSEMGGVFLDVRSDIYSLGATLYHLLSGQRPERDAKQVIPLARFPRISPTVAAIVTKAMDPDPLKRYQTAAEMRNALHDLYKKDPRVLRRKRRIRVALTSVIALFLLGGTCTFLGLKQMELLQRAYVLADRAANALEQGDVPQAIDYAMQALPEEQTLLGIPYTPEAQYALTSALGVYNLQDGYKGEYLLKLPSAPTKIELSPSGTFVAVVYSGHVEVFDLSTGESLADLRTADSALCDAIFAGDHMLLYAGKDGISAYDLILDEIKWSGKAATSLTLSADGTTVAGIFADENLASVYDVASGEALCAVSLQNRHQTVTYNDSLLDPERNLFALNETGTKLAVSFSDGGLRIYSLNDNLDYVDIVETSHYTSFQGTFYGDNLIYAASGSGEFLLDIADAQTGLSLGGFKASSTFRFQMNDLGLLVTMANTAVKLDLETGAQTELAYTPADILAFSNCNGYTIVTTEDGGFSVFDSQAKMIQCLESETQYHLAASSGSYAVLGSFDTGEVRILKLDRVQEQIIGTYPAWLPHDEARISADRKYIVLFSYESFYICSIDGTQIVEVVLPNPETIYDQQFRRDAEGSRLEVYYYDGTVLGYAAEDGTLLWERKESPKSETLIDQFETDDYRIESPLHGAPQIYDKDTGEKLGELQERDYLTYVTQVGDYIILEYISVDGGRYGLLCNGRCEPVAILPQLCDVFEDRLIFDDGRGNLRETSIFSLQELRELGVHMEERV